jgi:hypothetical protein
MTTALFATTLILAAVVSLLYWYACAVAEKDLVAQAPQYAAVLFRDHVEAFVMRLPPVRLSVLLRERPPNGAEHLVSPLRVLALVHLASVVIALLCFALWLWLA